MSFAVIDVFKISFKFFSQSGNNKFVRLLQENLSESFMKEIHSSFTDVTVSLNLSIYYEKYVVSV